MRLESKKDVEEYFSGDRIQCLICGKWFKQLPIHITSMHGISADEYKDKFNIPWGYGLTCQSTKEKKSIALKIRLANKDNNLKSIREVAFLNRHAPKRKIRDYEIQRRSVIKDYLRSMGAI